MKVLGWILAVSVLAITIPRYAEVFNTIDNTLWTALGMGILLAGGAAYIFHTWAKTKRQNSHWLLVAFGVNLAYEPFIIAPFVLARLRGISLAESMSHGYSVFWSIIVAAAPVILVGGVVLAIAFQKESKVKSTAQKTESTVQDGAIWRRQFGGLTKQEQVRLLAAQMPEWTHAQLAQEVGCSASTVTRALQEGEA